MKTLSAILERQAMRWIVLLAASFVLLFAQARDARLYGDALIYAGQARLIADSGEYATLKFGQELNHHGPLLFWLTAIAIKIFGPTPFAATFFSRLFGVGCIVLTFWVGAHLFGKNTGWLAAIALLTCYTFVRNTTTLRMDSALTFGVLLAMLGYLRGEKAWGPPLFYGGIAVAVLAKSLPGFLPLFLAPLHALVAGNLALPWQRKARRWLCGSLLLLVPCAWWGYLALRYGDEVLSEYLKDFLSPDGQPVDIRRLYLFFEIYIFDFARKYFPWIFFTIIGLWTTFRMALDKHRERCERADAALLLAWIITVLIAGGLKPSQYQRYLMPALPAVAVVTAMVIVRMCNNRVPAWISGGVAVLSITAPLVLSYTPGSSAIGSSQKYLAMAKVIDQRFSPHASVPFLTVRTNSEEDPFLFPGDIGRCRFFFGREPQALTIGDVERELRRGQLTLIVPTRAYEDLADEFRLATLIETNEWVLAEGGPI